ncbi:MAG: hypothetical protein DLM68_18000 [Hyphomicrobiales bacterium]|nr:MAG: hypothetical protein DLM68_18000 [Hyphomicrobiales bacterium]
MNGKLRIPAPVGRVKAASRASARPDAAGPDNTFIKRSPLTRKTVAEEPPPAASRRMVCAVAGAPLQSPAFIAFTLRIAASRLRGYVEPARAGRSAFDVDAALGSLAMEPWASFRLPFEAALRAS